MQSKLVDSKDYKYGVWLRASSPHKERFSHSNIPQGFSKGLMSDFINGGGSVIKWRGGTKLGFNFHDSYYDGIGPGYNPSDCDHGVITQRGLGPRPIK
ncbi:hypothetical protein ACOSQ4_004432 [Xanthoceras sorbifolium]